MTCGNRPAPAAVKASTCSPCASGDGWPSRFAIFGVVMDRMVVEADGLERREIRVSNRARRVRKISPIAQLVEASQRNDAVVCAVRMGNLTSWPRLPGLRERLRVLNGNVVNHSGRPESGRAGCVRVFPLVLSMSALTCARLRTATDCMASSAPSAATQPVRVVLAHGVGGLQRALRPGGRGLRDRGLRARPAEAEIGLVRDQHRHHPNPEYRSKDHRSHPVSTWERLFGAVCEVLKSIGKVRISHVNPGTICAL